MQLPVQPPEVAVLILQWEHGTSPLTEAWTGLPKDETSLYRTKLPRQHLKPLQLLGVQSLPKGRKLCVILKNKPAMFLVGMMAPSSRELKQPPANHINVWYCIITEKWYRGWALKEPVFIFPMFIASVLPLFTYTVIHYSYTPLTSTDTSTKENTQSACRTYGKLSEELDISRPKEAETSTFFAICSSV